MLAYRIHKGLLAILVALLSSCGPQGQVSRIIHPHSKLSAREAHEPTAKKPSSFTQSRSGLPNRCRHEVRLKDTFCISCDEGGTDIERCYGFSGTFDAAQSCVHAAEYIKCLTANPPFALNIALKGSLEKSLVENTRLWQESLRSIVKPRLDSDLQASLEAGLTQTTQLVQILVKARKDAQWVEQIFPQLAPPLKKAIAELQQQKEAGHLKLVQILEVSRMMLESGDSPATLLSYWEALSVEGLEAPGE